MNKVCNQTATAAQTPSTNIAQTPSNMDESSKRKLSEDSNDLGSDSSPFETSYFANKHVTDASRSSFTSKCVPNSSEDAIISRASKGSFSQPDFCDPGSVSPVPEDKDDQSSKMFAFSFKDP